MEFATPEGSSDVGLPARLSDALNESTIDPWPVSQEAVGNWLVVRLWLTDGRGAIIVVFGAFPEDHALVTIWDSQSESYRQYGVLAPELVDIARELARSRLAPVEKILVAPPDGSWLDE